MSSPVPSSPHLAPPAPRLEADEFVVDTPRLRRFVADVRAVLSHAADQAEALAALRPVLAELLAEDGWLPDEYGLPADASKGMGGGIGQWLLFRSKDADLCLFSLVVPGWRST